MRTSNLTTRTFTLLSVVLAAMILFSCSKDDETDFPMISDAPNGSSNILSEQEKDGLLYMVERQKLHRDVYLVVYENFSKNLAEDLCNCDSKLLDLLLIKIDKYGLENPCCGKDNGEYSSSSVQNSYDDFIMNYEYDIKKALIFAQQMEEAALNNAKVYLEQTDGHTDIVMLYSKIIADTESQLEVLQNELSDLPDIDNPLIPAIDIL